MKTQSRAKRRAGARKQANTRTQSKKQARARRRAQSGKKTRARAQAARQRRTQTRSKSRVQAARRKRRQAQTARSSGFFQRFSSRRLEAVVFVAVLLVAIGGLYFAYSGTGQAVRQLSGCKGGYVIPYMSPSGLSASYSQDFQFRGIEGNVMLLDIKNRKAAFRVNGVETPYLGYGQTFIGEQVGIKVGDISSNHVGICLASTVPDCADYYWDIDTKSRECGQWTSQAEELF
ncbi:hypothetical protein GF358_01380 [Candidatus Woesearchaeota archaeon]|nr:hypothetical protein [Candidatus Woesearchaeota archaeon]